MGQTITSCCAGVGAKAMFSTNEGDSGFRVEALDVGGLIFVEKHNMVVRRYADIYSNGDNEMRSVCCPYIWTRYAGLEGYLVHR